MRYFGFLVCVFSIYGCQGVVDNIIIWENNNYACEVKRVIFQQQLDNFSLAKNEQGDLAKKLKQQIDGNTINVWILAKDAETKSLLENWRNRFYWDNNLTFIDKSTNQVVNSVKEIQVQDLSGTFDIVIIESDTLFEARSIIY